MSPDPVLVDRLNHHGQAHLLRWWGELDATSRGASGGRDRRDRFRPARPADRRAGARRSGGSRRTPSDVQPIEVVRLPQTDGERMVWLPRERDRGRCAGRRRGRRHPGGRRLGHAPRLRRAQRDLPHRAGLVGEPVPDPRREDRRAGQALRASHPALHHDQPREPRSDDRLLRAARPVRPGTPPVLHPGADAGRRSVDRQGPPGLEGPGCALPRRAWRHPGRPGRPGRGRQAKLPGRDARPRRADPLLLPGR